MAPSIAVALLLALSSAEVRHGRPEQATPAKPAAPAETAPAKPAAHAMERAADAGKQTVPFPLFPWVYPWWDSSANAALGEKAKDLRNRFTAWWLAYPMMMWWPFMWFWAWPWTWLMWHPLWWGFW